MTEPRIMRTISPTMVVGFLLLVVQKYGYTIEKVGYNRIARYISERVGIYVTHSSVKEYLYKLEQLGYLQIDNKGTRQIRFTLIKEKVNNLLQVND